MFRLVFYSCFFAILVLPGVYALGATDDFQIRSFVGDDTTPPTTPVLLSVDPITSSQIDVVWSASSDDVFLFGYRLFRDGTQIATTTQTSFSDTGLLSETLYEYTVDAYDSFDNISSSSLPLSTTTLAAYVPPATTTPTTTIEMRATTGTLLQLTLDSILVTPAERSAVLMWQTNVNTTYTLRFGRTTSYELGSISTTIFRREHLTTLENLEPGTRYWYTIIATDTRGVSKELTRGEFTTRSSLQSDIPPNVRNVAVEVQATDVTLQWTNPVMPIGAYIRVMRSHLFYPTSVTDGALVYEGVGSEAFDKAALAIRTPQYYTVFVIDSSGGISSGAVAVARLVVASNEVETNSAATSTEIPPVLEAGDSTVLEAAMVFIEQGTKTQTLDRPVSLDAREVYTVSIPVSAVATHLKAIILSVQDPTDQRVSTNYLLKLNKKGDAYETVVQPPKVVGVSRLTIEVFDFYLASVRRISTQLNFTAPSEPEVIFPDDIFSYSKNFLFPVLIALVAVSFLFWLLFWRRHSTREDNR